MCGLVGVLSNRPLERLERSTFKTLLMLCQSRGIDSTGLLSVRLENGKLHYNVNKTLDKSNVFIERETTQRMIHRDKGVFILSGHTRAATCGSISLGNTHPFKAGHLIGMHNGTVPALYDDERDIVDSRVMFEQLNEEGMESVVKEYCGWRNNAMAVAYLDKSRQTFNLFRDTRRPLFIGLTKDCTFWASEKEMLEYAAHAHKLKFTEIFSLTPFMLNTVDLGNNFWKTEAIEASVFPAANYHSKAYAYSRIDDSDPPWHDTEYDGTKLVGPAMSKHEAERTLRLLITAVKPQPLKIANDNLEADGLPPSNTTSDAYRKPYQPRYGYQAFDKVFLVKEAKKLFETGCLGCGSTSPATRYWMNNQDFLCEDCREMKGVDVLLGGIVPRRGRAVPISEYPPSTV